MSDFDLVLPAAVDRTFQHVVTTYASETNKTASMWRAISGEKGEPPSRAARMDRSEGEGRAERPKHQPESQGSRALRAGEA